MSALQPDLDTCGCCKGVAVLTPASLDQPPRQPTLAYRAGVHGTFRATMLAQLSRQPALQDLTTRADDDPAIALIDAWAAALDVLTFYQERIANEGYLRTATERGSILELARAIGYELKPGVAASTYLAFDMEVAPTAPVSAIIPVGTKTQSLPGQNEKAQTYETVEQVEARPQWNRLKLKLTQSQTLNEETDEVYLKTLTTQVQKGDALLFVSNSQHWALRTVDDVKLDPPNDRTLVVLDKSLGNTEPTVVSGDTPKAYILRQRAALFGHNAPDWKAMTKDIHCAYDPDPCATTPKGTTAPDWPGIDKISSSVIDLDAVYPKIMAASWLVLENTTLIRLYQASSVATASVANFTFTARVTRVTPDVTTGLDQFALRETAVYAQSELVDLAEVESTTPLSGDRLDLAEAVAGLSPGRVLLVAGTTDRGEQSGEVAKVKAVKDAVVTLETRLQNNYVLNTVSVYGNVAPATHGETRTEVLGSGDAGKTFQRFELRNAPLTYVGADTPSGAASTLAVRINTVEWEEAPSLYGHGPRDRIFITRRSDDGKTAVQFGDGVNGARLPAGMENVSAVYRSGSGLGGLVKAKQLSLLMTRPLGVKSVLNPLAPSGADDPEARDQARRNAPNTVLTFERVVSLADFENFARTFSGIAKAQAASLWQHGRQTIFITVAGARGVAVPPTDPLQGKLRSAIRQAGATLTPFDILSYEKIVFAVGAEVAVTTGYLTEKVLQDVRNALETAFSFDSRSLGQSVTRSEVIAPIQAVDGVKAVNLTLFCLSGGNTCEERLIAQPIRRDKAGTVRPAQLIVIVVDPTLIELKAAQF